MLHRWRQRFEPELTGGTQPNQDERDEMERLRSELRDVKAENTLLKKVAALFAKEVK
jgi:transposase